MEPVSHAEITATMAALLDRADQNGRSHILGVAMSSYLLTFPPEQRYRATDDLMQRFRRMLPTLPLEG